MKPITSPDKGSIPAGPCRAGVAVIRNVAPSGLLIFMLCHGANLSAGVPSRCAPGVRREQARCGHCVSFAGAIEIVSVLVVAQEYRVDLSDLICLRAGPVSFFRVTCGSLYSPRASNVGSVIRRKPFASMSAVGPPIRVMTGALMITPAERPGTGLGPGIPSDVSAPI